MGCVEVDYVVFVYDCDGVDEVVVVVEGDGDQWMFVYVQFSDDFVGYYDVDVVVLLVEGGVEGRYGGILVVLFVWLG